MEKEDKDTAAFAYQKKTELSMYVLLLLPVRVGTGAEVKMEKSVKRYNNLQKERGQLAHCLRPQGFSDRRADIRTGGQTDKKDMQSNSASVSISTQVKLQPEQLINFKRTNLHRKKASDFNKEIEDETELVRQNSYSQEFVSSYIQLSELRQPYLDTFSHSTGHVYEAIPDQPRSLA